MSARWHKEVRALAYHCEYGGNYPAMHRSGQKLKAMGPTPRQLRRADRLGLKKLHKMMEKDRRWEAAGCPD